MAKGKHIEAEIIGALKQLEADQMERRSPVHCRPLTILVETKKQTRRPGAWP